MTTQPSTQPSPPSHRSLAKASAVAVATALVVLLTAVLPAEYGIDPLGTGRALGLMNLFGAEAAQQTITPGPDGPVFPQNREYRVDSQQFLLSPGMGFEYKYELEEGAAMVYTWTATAPIDFDFHTEPEGKPPEASDSFEKGNAAGGRGVYIAPYNGIHGWWWENVTQEDVEISLTSAGFYTAAKMFLGGGVVETFELSPPEPPQ